MNDKKLYHIYDNNCLQTSYAMNYEKCLVMKSKFIDQSKIEIREANEEG